MRRLKMAWQRAAQDRLGVASPTGDGQAEPDVEAVLKERLRRICDDGRAVWGTFEAQIRNHRFHTFVPGDYECVLAALTALWVKVGMEGRAPRLLELGSATGVIAIMADLVGYEACGIEIDPHLVEVARALAARHEAPVRFATGSYLPDGYEWEDDRGDKRLGTIGVAAPAYAELGHALDYFDVVYAYPWQGEQEIVHDLMARHGAANAWLLLHGGEGGVSLFRGGKPQV